MTGFKVGDSVRVIGNFEIKHYYDIGDKVRITGFGRNGVYRTERETPTYLRQSVHVDDLELIEECDTMAHNNGDLIKAQVSRDDYGAPVYNLFVKFGEFYYNLSSPKQMRGCKSLPRGSRHTVGTLSGAGDHMLAAIEGKDVPEEVADDGIPFDSEVVGISGPGKPAMWIDDGFDQWEKDHAETLKALRAFQDAFDASGLRTTNKLSDIEYAKKLDDYI